MSVGGKLCAQHRGSFLIECRDGKGRNTTHSLFFEVTLGQHFPQLPWELFEGRDLILLSLTPQFPDSCPQSVLSKCLLNCTDVCEFGCGGRQPCWYSPPSLHPRIRGLTSARSTLPVLSDSTQNEKVPLVPQGHA